MPHEVRHGDYLLSDDPARLDVDAIHRYLRDESYWARGIPREIVAESLRHSLCCGAYDASGTQVGLVRVITDFATYGWLCDVFVLPPHRGRGISKAMLAHALAHPRLKTLRRLALGTQDAHGLYAQFGFTPLANPQTQMEKRRSDPYGPGR